MSISRKLGAYSAAAGATVLGSVAVTNAELQIFDYRDSPLSANAIDAYYYPVSHDGAVLYMDGTLKRAVEEAGGYTYYDQDGNVTTPIDAADKTANAVWFTYHDFKAAGSMGYKGYTGIFAYTGSGAGVAAHPYNGDVAGEPLFEVEHGNNPDIGLEVSQTEVHGGLSFTTGHAVMFAQGGSGSAPGWGGSSSWGDRKGFCGRGFVGFALEEDDGTHYGWVDVGFGWRPTGMTIYGWAYEDLAYTPALLTYEPPGPPPGDFDDNTHVDTLDIDLLCDFIRNGMPYDDLYDISADGLTGGTDGVVDTKDLDYLIRFLVETTIGNGTEYGDFNLDGVIDTTDLTRLATYYGAGDTWAKGNANRYIDLITDTTDLTILATYYGFGEPDVVPEPMTLGLLALGASGLLARRRALPAPGGSRRG